jgi:O-antigen/teichoic acid export membrane protein/glycosyltransferase involved in cell wall biosynthesis
MNPDGQQSEPGVSPARDTTPVHAGFAKSLGRGTSVMVVLTLLASVANYASNLIFSRLLSTVEYGELTALLAITVIAAVPTGAAQTMVAERVAALRTRGENEKLRFLIRHALAHVVVIAAIVAALYLAAMPLVKSALGLQQIGPALALAPLLIVSLFLPVACGVLQGLERFVLLGVILVVIACSRIAFGVPWTLAGGGAGGPLFGQALGTVVALALVGVLLRKYKAGRGTGAATTGLRRRPNRRTLAAAGAFTAFALLSNLDVVLVKLVLSPHAAGVYAALATVEKIIIFLPSAIAVVMVPSAAKAKLSHQSTTRVLRLSAALVLAATLCVAVPAALAPRLVLQLMFGHKYLVAAPGILPIVCAGGGLSLLYLLLVYAVTIKDGRWVWLLVAGVGLQVLGILLLHSSPVQVATVQASVVLLVLLLNEFFFHPILRGEKPSVATAPSTPAMRRSNGRTLLSLIVPAFNAAAYIETSLAEIIATLDRLGAEFEILVVSDGCTDGTPEAVQRVADPRVQLIQYAANQGKGHALCLGATHAEGRYVGWLDADLDVSPEVILDAVGILQSGGVDAVIGSKRHPRSAVHYPRSRRTLSAGFQLLVRILFRVKVRDTQVGAKVFRGEMLRTVVPLLLIKRYAFDLEVLAVGAEFGFDRVEETPITLAYRFTGTGVNARAVRRMFLDTLAIAYRIHLRHWYVRQFAALERRRTDGAELAPDGYVMTETVAPVAPVTA